MVWRLLNLHISIPSFRYERTIEGEPMKPRTAFRLMPVVLLFVGVAAHAEEWVSVWTPPKPADGGMESFVDRASIAATPDNRRAKWRMVRWASESYAKEHPSATKPVGVSFVIVVSTFDCGKELMRDEQTTMYYADGTNNAGAIGPSNWGTPVGATRAVYDFVCKAAL
jgi:hypothetical protein